MGEKELIKLKELIEGVAEKFKTSQEARVKLEETLTGKMQALTDKMEELEKSQDTEEIKKLKSGIEDLENEISDVRTKAASATTIQTTEQEHEAVKGIVRRAAGSFIKAAKADGTKGDLLKGIGAGIAEQIKTLNVTNNTEGAFAVAEVLQRDVIEYAREFSPIMELIGRDPIMTRNYRTLVLTGYPGVSAGIENVAGSVLPQTSTQEYSEVRSKTWKVYAKPRITDEAMSAPDVDLYGHLLELLGQEMSIHQAAQVLQGTGTDTSTTTNARGILSARVDITDTTGESFKASTGSDARDHDIYPVRPTGVSGSLGATDVAIVNYFIDLINDHPTRFLEGAYFLMNRRTKGILEKVRDAQNRPLLVNNYREGGGPMILGYPIFIDDTMPNVAADSTPIIFGLLNRAFYVNDGDIDQMLLDPYSVDQCTLVKTSKEMFERVGNSDAITIVGCTTNSGS